MMKEASDTQLQRFKKLIASFMQYSINKEYDFALSKMPELGKILSNPNDEENACLINYYLDVPKKADFVCSEDFEDYAREAKPTALCRALNVSLSNLDEEAMKEIISIADKMQY